MAGFPLFRLPLLPLKTIFGKMCIGDLISFHLCSKKTRGLCKLIKKSVSFDSLSLDQKNKLDALEKIRLLSLEIQNNSGGSLTCFPKESITIRIVISSGLIITIDKNDNCANKYQDCFPIYIQLLFVLDITKFASTEIKNVQINGKTLPIVTEAKREVYTFWADLSEGLNVLIDYFKKLFNSESVECHISNVGADYSFTQNLKIAAKEMAQHTLMKCIVSGYISNDYNYNFILDSFNPTICFEQVNRNKSLVNRYDGCYSIFKSEYFVLEPTNWFKLDKLSSMDCKYIKLLKSNFTNNDMYECIIRWMDGQYPKLKCLTVQLEEPVNLRCVPIKYNSRYIPSRVQYFPQSQSNVFSKYTVVLELAAIQIKLDNKTVATISNKESQQKNVFEMNIL